MRRTVLVALAVLVLAFAVSASAQNVVNPTGFTFACSPDHATVTKYTIGIFVAQFPNDPAWQFDVGKPTPEAGNVCRVTVDLSSVPLGVAYFARGRASGGTTVSPWSEPGGAFDRTLAAPGPPTPIRQ